MNSPTHPEIAKDAKQPGICSIDERRHTHTAWCLSHSPRETHTWSHLHRSMTPTPTGHHSYQSEISASECACHRLTHQAALLSSSTFFLSVLDSTLLRGRGFLNSVKACLHHLHVTYLESRAMVDIVTAFHAVRPHTFPRRKDSRFQSIATPACIRLLCTGAAVCQRQPLGS